LAVASLSNHSEQVADPRRFKYTLREENAILFDQMLKECQKEDDKEGEGVQFANAVNSKGERFAADSMFMALMLLQQLRVINTLIQKLSIMNNPVRQKED
jgi:hypothetical protein